MVDFSAELNTNAKNIINGMLAGGVFDFFINGFTVPAAIALVAVLAVININSKASYIFESAKEGIKLANISIASKASIIKTSIDITNDFSRFPAMLAGLSH